MEGLKRNRPEKVAQLSSLLEFAKRNNLRTEVKPTGNKFLIRVFLKESDKLLFQSSGLDEQEACKDIFAKAKAQGYY